MQPVYATREEIKAELDVRETARSNARIDRALDDASRAVEALCHRTFYPWQGERRFDWPGSQYRPSWRIWLDDHGLISLTSITSGGVAINPDDVVLYPNSGPPYTRIETNLGTSATWGGGDTHQQDVTITGLWGYRNDETPAGTLAEALDDTETGVDVDAATSAAVGVGALLRIDDERLIVTGRTQLDTGQTVGGAGLTAINNSVTVTVQDGTGFAAGEVLLIDGERLRIDDIAGNTLIVTRAWDGSTIAAHTAGAVIYAPRALTVQRAAVGTTATAHALGAAVHLFVPPGPVRQYVVAETLTSLLQGRSGYARTAGSGESEREATGTGLRALRDRVYASHGRHARSRGV